MEWRGWLLTFGALWGALGLPKAHHGGGEQVESMLSASPEICKMAGTRACPQIFERKTPLEMGIDVTRCSYPFNGPDFSLSASHRFAQHFFQKIRPPKSSWVSINSAIKKSIFCVNISPRPVSARRKNQAGQRVTTGHNASQRVTKAYQAWASFLFGRPRADTGTCPCGAGSGGGLAGPLAWWASFSK